jgi:hypothetical protein
MGCTQPRTRSRQASACMYNHPATDQYFVILLLHSAFIRSPSIPTSPPQYCDPFHPTSHPNTANPSMKLVHPILPNTAQHCEPAPILRTVCRSTVCFTSLPLLRCTIAAVLQVCRHGAHVICLPLPSPSAPVLVVCRSTACSPSMWLRFRYLGYACSYGGLEVQAHVCARSALSTNRKPFKTLPRCGSLETEPKLVAVACMIAANHHAFDRRLDHRSRGFAVL